MSERSSNMMVSSPRAFLSSEHIACSKIDIFINIILQIVKKKSLKRSSKLQPPFNNEWPLFNLNVIDSVAKAYLGSLAMSNLNFLLQFILSCLLTGFRVFFLSSFYYVGIKCTQIGHEFTYRVFIKLCVFSFKCCDFF